MTVGTLLVVALSLTAGCSQPLIGDGAPEETPTVTPVPIAEDGSRGADDGRLGGEELAPGVQSDGIADPARLLAAHDEALSNRSYTVRLSSRRETNQSTTVTYGRAVRVGEDGHFHYVLTTETPGGEYRIERWRGAETAAEAVTEKGNTTYRRLEDPAIPNLLTGGDLWRLFVALPADVEAIGDRDGTAVHRVTGGPGELPPLSNVTYAVEVTERGLIRAYEVRYDLAGRTPGTTVTVTATVSGVGETTVERPPWVDDAT
jgi:hypothetical protein